MYTAHCTFLSFKQMQSAGFYHMCVYYTYMVIHGLLHVNLYHHLS